MSLSFLIIYIYIKFIKRRIIMEMSITRTCKEPTCKKEFTISAEEVKWLKNNGLKFFKRCSDCRKKRREEAHGKLQ